jgi:hypothetical protein
MATRFERPGESDIERKGARCSRMGGRDKAPYEQLFMV